MALSSMEVVMIIDNFTISGALITLVTAIVLIYLFNHEPTSRDQD